MKKSTICLASLLTFASFAADKPATEGATPGQWTMDLDAARKVATEKKLPILINFTGSDWCDFCKLMDKEVFSQETWKTYAKGSLMLVWIDFPQDKTLVPEKYVKRNADLAKFFGIESYPAYILLDDDGKNQLGLLRASQEINPALFISRLKTVLRNRSAEVEKLMKTVPEKVAQEYTATSKKLKEMRTELKASEDSYQKKSADLNTQIDICEKRLDAIQTEAFIAKLPKEKAEAYMAKKTRLNQANAELKTWLAARPGKHRGQHEKVHRLESRDCHPRNRHAGVARSAIKGNLFDSLRGTSPLRLSTCV